MISSHSLVYYFPKLSFGLLEKRVSTCPRRPEDPGNVLKIFSFLEFVLEFTIFRVSPWKCPGIFLYSLPFFHSHYLCVFPWKFCLLYSNFFILTTSYEHGELHIVNYATIHLIFPIWKEMQLLAFQMWRSARIREFLESHFQYHFLQKRKAMLWILLCRV